MPICIISVTIRLRDSSHAYVSRTADSMKNRFGELTRFAEMARRDPDFEMSLANGTHVSAIHAVSSLVSSTSIDRSVALSKRLIRTAAVSAAFGTVVGRSISNHNMTFIGSGVLRGASKQSTCLQVASRMPGAFQHNMLFAILEAMGVISGSAQ